MDATMNLKTAQDTARDFNVRCSLLWGRLRRFSNRFWLRRWFTRSACRLWV